MKKLLLFSIFLLISLISEAQTVYKTEALNTKYGVDSISEYTAWNGWEACYVLVVLNLHESTLDVHSLYEQHYNILSVENSIIRPGVIGIQFDAIDRDGARCTIELLYYESADKHHLYIRWKNLELLYQMKKI